MAAGNIRFLSQEETIAAGALDMGIAVPTMEEVFRLHALGEYQMPDKTVLRWGDLESEATKGRVNAMPGWIGGKYNMAGIKWIGSSPSNPFKRNLPRATAIIVLNDSETLAPIAIMDGAAISASRTGANTGVAVKYLARENAESVAIIGAGVQGRTQLLATLHSRPGIKDVRVYDLVKERAITYAKEMSPSIAIDIKVCDTAREAVAGADIYITATLSSQPIIFADWLEKGVLYSHVGNNECDFDAIKKFDKRVVDNWEALKHRGIQSLAVLYHRGEIDESAIDAELGEIITGVKTGRDNDDQSIYVNTVGMGIEDVALATEVYRKAIEKGLGTELRLWKNPFAI